MEVSCYIKRDLPLKSHGDLFILLSGIANTNLIHFNLIDCPGLLFQDFSFDSLLFLNTKSLIFVIDAQVIFSLTYLHFHSLSSHPDYIPLVHFRMNHMVLK